MHRRVATAATSLLDRLPGRIPVTPLMPAAVPRYRAGPVLRRNILRWKALKRAGDSFIRGDPCLKRTKWSFPSTRHLRQINDGAKKMSCDACAR